MFNILSYQENANQNYFEISSILVIMAKVNKKNDSSCWQDREKEADIFMAGTESRYWVRGWW